MQKIFPIAFDKAVFHPLETFENPSKDEDIKIQIIHPEFSCVCPKTGYPDFARVILRYVPDELCVELKSWKIFLSDFYGVGHFHEPVTKAIFDEVRLILKPKFLEVMIDWGARGGVKTVTSIKKLFHLSTEVDIDDWNDCFETAVVGWHNN